MPETLVTRVLSRRLNNSIGSTQVPVPPLTSTRSPSLCVIPVLQDGDSGGTYPPTGCDSITKCRKLTRLSVQGSDDGITRVMSTKRWWHWNHLPLGAPESRGSLVPSAPLGHVAGAGGLENTGNCLTALETMRNPHWFESFLQTLRFPFPVNGKARMLMDHWG